MSSSACIRFIGRETSELRLGRMVRRTLEPFHAGRWWRDHLRHRVAHDIGLVATPIAMLALVVAVSIAVGALRTPRLGRGNLVPGLVVLGIIAAGLFLAGRMVGFF